MEQHVPVAGSRWLAIDDEGDPAGRPVVFLHGTPSSALSRHPDTSLAVAAGVRLLAVNRPGIGGSSPDPETTPGTFAADLAAALDGLGVERADVLAWSAGSLWALAAAAVLRERVGVVTIAAGAVPIEAYRDREVLRACTAQRLAIVDEVAERGPAGAADTLLPILAPIPCSIELAVEHLREVDDPVEHAELLSVPGGERRMAESLCAAVADGGTAVGGELRVLYSPLGVTLATVHQPVRLVYGDADRTCPPAFGRWLAARLPDARLEVMPASGHGLAWTHWSELLTPR